MSGPHNITRLQDKVAEYAHDLLATHTVREYGYIIGKWHDYINRVVDAEKMALDEHQKVLNGILNERQQKQQTGAMFAMLALTLVTGPALSWIGGAIQYRLYPALASQTRWKSTMVYVQSRMMQSKPRPQILSISESEHNKVAAKIFGDAAVNLGQQVGVERMLVPLAANHGVAPRAPTGKSYQELTALAQIQPNADSRDLHQSLRTKLEAALNDERERTIKTISDLALAVRRNPNFGKNAVEYLLKTYPQIRGDHSGPIMDGVADRFIEKLVDDQRNKWAKEWLYYGNLPPQTSILEMSRKIEREIWAMWLMDQGYRYVEYDAAIVTGEAVSGYIKRQYVEGRNKLRFNDLVVERLIELGVLLPQTSRQLAALNDRNANSSHKEHPTVLVRGSVDDAAELEEIQTWAKNKQPEFLSGHFDSMVRNIGSIVNVHKIAK